MSISMSDAASLLGAVPTGSVTGYALVPVETLDALFGRCRKRTGFDLPKRCQEIVEWRRTGRYVGTELQRMGDSLDDQNEEDPPLARAELLTIREALRFTAAFRTNGEPR